MSKTGIQWTDETWNPVTGCDKISQGCKNCYAETLHTQRYNVNQKFVFEHPDFRKPEHRGTLTPAQFAREKGYALPMPPTYDTPFTTVVCHPERLREPLSWRKPKRVFTCSMGDLFHEDVPDAFLDQVFAVMALTPRITYQVLTKRPERMREYMAEAVKERWFAAAKDMVDSGQMTSRDLNRRAWVPNGEPQEDADGQMRVPYTTVFHRFPLPNAWLGTSVENQEAADLRIPELLATPAAVRFLSCEPLLGPVSLAWANTTERTEDNQQRPITPGALAGLHWVIVGGESGAGARPCDLGWVRDIVRQCRAAGVAPFVKQLGSRPTATDFQLEPLRYRHNHGGNIEEWPEDLRVRDWPVALP